MQPLISVILPSYRTHRTQGVYSGTLRGWSGVQGDKTEGEAGLQRLKLVIESIQMQSLAKKDYEVVVIDDGSDYDLTREIAEWNLSIQIRVLRQHNKGFVHSFNRGIRESSGEIVFFALDHNLIGPLTLESHVTSNSRNTVGCGHQHYYPPSVLLNDKTEPGIDRRELISQTQHVGTDWIRSAVEYYEWGNKVVRLKEDLRRNFEKLEYLSCCTPEYRDIEHILRDDKGDRLRCRWLVMRFGNHSVPRNLLESIGGLDEELDKHHGWYADFDLGLRLQLANANFRLVDQAMAIDLFHGNPLSAQVGRATGLAYLAGKHKMIDVLLLPNYLGNLGIGIEEYSCQAEVADRYWEGASVFEKGVT